MKDLLVDRPCPGLAGPSETKKNQLWHLCNESGPRQQFFIVYRLGRMALPPIDGDFIFLQRRLPLRTKEFVLFQQ